MFAPFTDKKILVQISTSKKVRNVLVHVVPLARVDASLETLHQ